MDSKQVRKIIDGWADKRVAVIGDLMLDRYVWGKAARISPEAPVPVVEVGHTTVAPGGAANVLRNIATLEAKSVAFGVVGDDATGDQLRELLDGLWDRE